MYLGRCCCLSPQTIPHQCSQSIATMTLLLLQRLDVKISETKLTEIPATSEKHAWIYSQLLTEVIWQLKDQQKYKTMGYGLVSGCASGVWRQATPLALGLLVNASPDHPQPQALGASPQSPGQSGWPVERSQGRFWRGVGGGVGAGGAGLHGAGVPPDGQPASARRAAATARCDTSPPRTVRGMKRNLPTFICVSLHPCLVKAALD